MNLQNLNKGVSTTTGIIIVIIVAVFATAILVWQEGLITQIIVPSIPATTPDETANWKTYKNEQYGFEIKYPREAVKQAETERQQPPYFSYEVSNLPIISENPALSQKGFHLRVINQRDSYFYSFWCGPGFSNSRGYLEDQTYRINGIDFTARTFSEAGTKSWGDYPEYFTIKDGRCFVVTFSLIGERYTGPEDNIVYETPYYKDEELDLFRQIMSTFKFNEL